jgi:hypothetical protein
LRLLALAGKNAGQILMDFRHRRLDPEGLLEMLDRLVESILPRK